MIIVKLQEHYCLVELNDNAPVFSNLNEAEEYVKEAIMDKIKAATKFIGNNIKDRYQSAKSKSDNMADKYREQRSYDPNSKHYLNPEDRRIRDRQRLKDKIQSKSMRDKFDREARNRKDTVYSPMNKTKFDHYWNKQND